MIKSIPLFNLEVFVILCRPASRGLCNFARFEIVFIGVHHSKYHKCQKNAVLHYWLCVGDTVTLTYCGWSESWNGHEAHGRSWSSQSLWADCSFISFFQPKRASLHFRIINIVLVLLYCQRLFPKSQTSSAIGRVTWLQTNPSRFERWPRTGQASRPFMFPLCCGVVLGTRTLKCSNKAAKLAAIWILSLKIEKFPRGKQDKTKRKVQLTNFFMRPSLFQQHHNPFHIIESWKPSF